MNQDEPKIIIKKGNKPGKTVAIFCGIHGNEKAGIMAMDSLIENIEVISGIVYLVYANTRAIEKGIRFTESNLNRAFIRNKKVSTYEENLSEKLMDILDECDALLDLHAYRDSRKETVPFLICESDAYDFASKTEFPIIVSNIDSVEKGGTDGYMFNQGKIGICAELGAIERPEDYVDLGIRVAHQFLQYFGSIKESVPYESSPIQEYMSVCMMHKKVSQDFQFSQEYKNFDEISSEEIIAVELGKEIVAPHDGYILFPNPDDAIGIETFIFAKKI